MKKPAQWILWSQEETKNIQIRGTDSGFSIKDPERMVERLQLCVVEMLREIIYNAILMSNSL